MVNSLLPTKPGISSARVNSIPEQWSSEWFRRFITQWLQQGDTRNSISGPGLTISSDINTPATLSVASNIAALNAEPYLLVTAPSDAFLTNYRKLVAGSGISIGDGGATNNLTVGLAQAPAYTVKGNATGSTGPVTDLTSIQISGSIGLNSVTPPAQVTGFGTPTGPSVIANFPGASATLAQTSAAVAQLIKDRIAEGRYGV